MKAMLAHLLQHTPIKGSAHSSFLQSPLERGTGAIAISSDALFGFLQSPLERGSTGIAISTNAHGVCPAAFSQNISACLSVFTQSTVYAFP